MQIKMPHAISAYVQATNERDNDTFGALFTTDAIVHDEGQEHRGVAAIRRWLTSTVEQYRFTLTPTSSFSGRKRDYPSCKAVRRLPRQSVIDAFSLRSS